MEVVNACPHHGFDTWMLVSYFYEGMSPTMKQLLETMCGGHFMSKSPNEAFEFFNYVAEISRSRDEPHERDLHKSKSQSNSKGGMYMLNEDVDLQAKMIALTKRLEVLEAKGFHEVNAIYDNPVYMEQCASCQSIEHEVSDCPTIPTMGERLVENHPNMSWNCGQEQFSSSQYSQSQQFMEDSPQQVSLVEQAVVNLSKILGDFIGDQKNINTQINQRIDHVETSFNKKFDSLQTNLTQKIDNMQLPISKLTSMHTMQEKENSLHKPNKIQVEPMKLERQVKVLLRRDEVKATITLRGEQEKGKEVNEDDRSKEDEILKEEVKKKDMLLAPPFPKALQSKKVHGTKEEEELKEAYLIELPMEELVKEKVEDNFSKLGEVISNERIEVWRINEEIQPLKLMKWSFSFKKVKTMKHGVHNNQRP
ncbi:hypothetical protein CK203_108645 [Vitis vinifera]|uniref:Retrotransposon gag domain-containing protein n=1 Tax=Vitis vinifera TaxID=29760 RepID=A0A438BP50_VITVI|nr:hypothetical protein CK203_108645 [Vitis vinifera]